MERVTKEADVRKNEILDIAYKLFNAKGFVNTSIEEIVQEIGIAKGTVYYYFKSKEDIFKALVERRCNELIAKISNVADNDELNACSKIEAMLAAEYLWEVENDQFLSHLHKWKNIENNQQALIYITKKYSPILSNVIRQGIKEGIFQTDFPLESSRLIMTGHRVLFDQTHFVWSKEELINMAKAHQDVIECALRAKKGTFSFITSMVEAYANTISTEA